MLCVLLGTQAHSADFYSSNFEIGDFKESPLFLHKEKKGLCIFVHRMIWKHFLSGLGAQKWHAGVLNIKGMFYLAFDCMPLILTWWVTIMHLSRLSGRARRVKYLSADVKTETVTSCDQLQQTSSWLLKNVCFFWTCLNITCSTLAVLPYSLSFHSALLHSRNRSVLGDEYLCASHLLLHLTWHRQQL